MVLGLFLIMIQHIKLSYKPCIDQAWLPATHKNQLLIDQATELLAAHQSITPNYTNLKLTLGLECVLHFVTNCKLPKMCESNDSQNIFQKIFQEVLQKSFPCMKYPS